jgi:hypothetical protein
MGQGVKKIGSKEICWLGGFCLLCIAFRLTSITCIDTRRGALDYWGLDRLWESGKILKGSQTCSSSYGERDRANMSFLYIFSFRKPESSVGRALFLLSCFQE